MGKRIIKKRRIVRRDNKITKGYWKINTDFLLDYLFLAAFGPQVRIDLVPLKVWGQSLRDTLDFHL